MKEAAFYKISQDEVNIDCGLCPHNCKIASGKSGICGVRRNRNGALIAESYGKVTSIALDPVEKKPLYHFYPGSKILSIGSYGCNFNCGFCQNHRISAKSALYQMFSPNEIAATSKDLVLKGNIGVAYTYNEPLIGYEFVKDCAELLRKQRQKNVLVTNGFIMPEPFNQLLQFIDAANIDLKSFNPLFYKEIGGKLENVKNNIINAVKSCHVEVTTLIIPGKNDSPKKIEALAEWLAEIDDKIPLHISRFFPAYKMQDISPTPIDTIYNFVEIAGKYLRCVYPGNC